MRKENTSNTEANLYSNSNDWIERSITIRKTSSNLYNLNYTGGIIDAPILSTDILQYAFNTSTENLFSGTSHPKVKTLTIKENQNNVLKI